MNQDRKFLQLKKRLDGFGYSLPFTMESSALVRLFSLTKNYFKVEKLLSNLVTTSEGLSQLKKECENLQG